MSSIKLVCPARCHEVEVSGLTTLKYAVKRLMEELGYDDGLPWLYVDMESQPESIPDQSMTLAELADGRETLVCGAIL